MNDPAAEKQELKTLWTAIDEAWHENAPDVDRFGLIALRAGIQHEHAGWTVPVVAQAPNGSAYELVRVLNLLQESIETKSKLWITLYLDPFANTPTNGVH